VGFVIIIDGPNFINDLHRYGKDTNFVLNDLSIPRINGSIQTILNKMGSPATHLFTLILLSQIGVNLANLRMKTKQDS
jgi:hypothetical protein